MEALQADDRLDRMPTGLQRECHVRGTNYRYLLCTQLFAFSDNCSVFGLESSMIRIFVTAACFTFVSGTAFASVDGHHDPVHDLPMHIGLTILVATILAYLGHVAKIPELTLLMSVGWCFAVCAAALGFGLSLEMGALIAGVSISTFPYNLDVVAKTITLRDFSITISSSRWE